MQVQPPQNPLTAAIRSSKSLADGRPIIWEEHPKQGVFLAAGEDEVLYGGAAGGGKSDAMLVDALGLSYGAAYNKNHRAVIFRRTYPDLKDLISRSQELYPAMVAGAKYNKTEHIWTFPSGATIEFAHLQHDDRRLDYRGRAWNWIGFEELTLWPTDVCWVYLSSRCRSTDPTLPCYMRATTNPDGPGQAWVMQRFGIDELGNPSMQCIEVEDERELADGTFELYQKKVWVRFIPARLTDNPSLRGTGYRATLNRLPPDEREALLDGLWRGNQVKGAYYAKEMTNARKAGRLISNMVLARAVPVNGYWDLGKNDSTAIVFHQYAASEHRFPQAYENSGEVLEHYAEYLRKTYTDRKWAWGTQYLPHDAETFHLVSKTNAKQQLEALLPGVKFVVVPRVLRLIDGIQATRTKFPTCWFDRAGCSDLIAALDNYRKKWNPRTSTYSDEEEQTPYNNYADAFRQFGQGFLPNAGYSQQQRTVERPSRGPA